MSTSSAGLAVRAVSTPHKKPSRKVYKESVTLVVGQAKEHYTLHKDLLCFYSDFFRAAFNGSFKEASERKIELPEVKIEVFETFQVWLYTQTLPRDESEPTKIYPSWTLLIDLWIFGDKHQIPLLQNNAIDALLDKVSKDTGVPTHLMNYAYENTTSESHLRKALVDIVTYRAVMTDTKGTVVDTHFAKTSRPWSTQVCVDVMAEMDRGWRVKKVERYGYPMRSKCHFHIHFGGEHC